ncbi:MAG: type II secretion system F family protein [Rhizobiales bacterium]|nr:type II secretion system F family protein [Hyphomicrobiales bacterium]
MDFLAQLVGDGDSIMLSLLVFLAAGTLAFTVMAIVRVQGSINRRAANIGQIEMAGRPMGSRSLRHSSMKAAHRLVEYTARHYATGDAKGTKVLRQRLIQAGIYSPRAPGYFFLSRTVLAIGLATLAFLFSPAEAGSSPFWLLIFSAGSIGYVAPGLYIGQRIKNRTAEHRAGFPDFLDLLVVCADAGLSMEAALDRVGTELGVSYPSLSGNIHLTNLEIRAGRTMSESLEHLGDRLGIEEARSFATLIQQSTELGSSITDALRVYSDDMRHKRLSRAEEKAYSLPAKLAVPMMLCIFPVLFVVILLPVFVRLYVGNY